MDIGFGNASDIIKDITKDLNKIHKMLAPQRKNVLSRMAKAVKNHTIESLPRSDQYSTATNYDGTPYTHMKSDIKITIRDDKDGMMFANIHGGKHTGYKWHMLNNGTSNTRATHFIDRAMKLAESELEAIIDEAISEAVQDGD